MKQREYDRHKSCDYAEKWALSRNSKYYNYEKIGGDCTNFVSQCIYAGCGIMNYNNWYYKNANNKSASWTGVEYLYNFLVNNKNQGPVGVEVSQNNIQLGDVVQISKDGNKYSHSMLIIGIKNANYLSDIYIATHSFDVYGRSLITYDFKKIRFVHIEKVFY